MSKPTKKQITGNPVQSKAKEFQVGTNEPQEGCLKKAAAVKTNFKRIMSP